MVSIDFFTVPTIRFQILYVFLGLAHHRRRIVHPPELGAVVAIPQVGGLHHRYERRAG
jgi:hypothetical protein